MRWGVAGSFSVGETQIDTDLTVALEHPRLELTFTGHDLASDYARAVTTSIRNKGQAPSPCEVFVLFPSAAIFADIATFTAIANRPGQSVEAIAGTIVFPHPPMPRTRLTFTSCRCKGRDARYLRCKATTKPKTIDAAGAPPITRDVPLMVIPRSITTRRKNANRRPYEGLARTAVTISSRLS
jgi:hypothetical protein